MVSESGTTPARPAGMADTRFDADALIAEFGDEGLVAELAEILLAHADEQIGAVHTAIATGNAGALKSAAHKIKGGVGTFGAAPVTNLAMALEALGREERLVEAPPLAARLDSEMKALCDGARLWLSARA